VTRAKRPLAVFGAGAATFALAACGGSTIRDSVPSNPPAITPVLTNKALDNTPDSAGGSASSSTGTGATGLGSTTSVSTSTTPVTTTPVTTTPATGTTNGGTAGTTAGGTTSSGGTSTGTSPSSAGGGGVVAPTGST